MKFIERIEESLRKRKKYRALNMLMDFEKWLASSSKKERQFQWILRHHAERLTGVGICEREIYLKEEISSLEKKAKIGSLSETEAQRLEAYEEELKGLDMEWWLHKRAMNDNLDHRPKGSSARRFIHSQELRPEAQRRMCRTRGGCCNYDCGCCETLRVCSRGTLLGHCTGQFCGCCIRRRGSEKIPEVRPATYYHRIWEDMLFRGVSVSLIASILHKFKGIFVVEENFILWCFCILDAKWQFCAGIFEPEGLQHFIYKIRSTSKSVT